MPGRRIIVVSEREHSFVDVDDRPEICVGRAPEADIVLKDDMVSRKHCLILNEGGELRVRDLKSFNGTYLNERRVREEPFLPWDSLRVGRTKMFLVDRVGAPDPNASGSRPAPAAEGEPPVAPAEADGEGGVTKTLEMDAPDLGALLQSPVARRVVDDLLRRERERAEREVGRRVRDESAPAVLPTLERFRLRVRRYGPADGGGDFYDVFPSGGVDGSVFVGLGTVSGVGVAACVAASAARHTLRGIVSAERDDPDKVLELHLEVLRHTLHPGSAVSLLLGRLGVSGRTTLAAVGGTGVLHYVSAADKVEVLRPPGRRDEEAMRPQLIELTLRPDDRLLLVSDGAGSIRQVGGAGEVFGADRLAASFQAGVKLDPKELTGNLADELQTFCQDQPDRDATVLVATIK